MSTGEKTKPNKWVSYLIEGAILALALLLVVVIRSAVYEPALVISRSMEPTMLVEDRLLIDHRESLHDNWRRGDVVLFATPQTWSDEPNEEVASEDRDQLIKRIIGLPGEKVDVLGDKVWINGRPLREDYIRQTRDPVLVPISVVLARGQYFVMGDNRGNSEDSRQLGPISDEDIIGRAIRILWPLERAGSVPLPDYEP